MVKFTKNKPSEAGGGPSSAIGIMRFFDADSKSPKLSPYFVLGVSLIFVIAMLIWGTMI
ncbi:MAG: preprotein translocase subunit Sec61beta [Candidatus Diapherotrites archaeon]|jgi:preprotein translocase subunit Sec61beta|uniref:Preprotein translocase subunit Sec61beta n=1 Tax=Candidatus Iainarchaeum sp. TaxID=3101447 RepID=A0A8T5GHE8_9ARCH|nr:preprotein translocase subunit Sec61beta [Candidatus Diapherotrites archaeon]MBT7241145.1 preprotein translocase subunit Sec61beta [Candidatus Diapherotrites archaeon]